MVGQGVQPVGQPLTRLCLSKFGIRLIVAGIHGPSGQGTDRSGSVRDFQNFSGPGPVLGFEILPGPGPWIPALVRGSRSWSVDP